MLLHRPGAYITHNDPFEVLHVHGGHRLYQVLTATRRSGYSWSSAARIFLEGQQLCLGTCL